MYIPQLKNTVLLKNTNHQTSLYQVVIFLLVERFVSMLMKMQLSEKHNKASTPVINEELITQP